MTRKIDTSDQFIEFYKKKGDYLVSLSENHFKNIEYRKCLELLNEAYVMYKKGNYTESAENTKQKFMEIKEKYFKKNTG
jgi:aspartyl/asparaginyl-tRNA synthetase